PMGRIPPSFRRRRCVSLRALFDCRLFLRSCRIPLPDVRRQADGCCRRVSGSPSRTPADARMGNGSACGNHDRRRRRTAQSVSRQDRCCLKAIPVPDTALAALQDRIRAAAADRRPLRIRGGGTKDFYGGPLDGETLDVRALSGIVAYAPGELVVTARGGTPLAEVEDALAAHGQMLAFEPPYHGAAATLGGIVATGFSGPRRAHAGSARDFVLGVRIVDGTGTPLAFGGQVIKNVAGFDVARLMTGALGTLGVLTEISLKCVPRPR